MNKFQCKWGFRESSLPYTHRLLFSVFLLGWGSYLYAERKYQKSVYTARKSLKKLSGEIEQLMIESEASDPIKLKVFIKSLT